MLFLVLGTQQVIQIKTEHAKLVKYIELHLNRAVKTAVRVSGLADNYTQGHQEDVTALQESSDVPYLALGTSD